MALSYSVTYSTLAIKALSQIKKEQKLLGLSVYFLIYDEVNPFLGHLR